MSSGQIGKKAGDRQIIREGNPTGKKCCFLRERGGIPDRQKKTTSI